jgi:hypothetical protein
MHLTGTHQDFRLPQLWSSLYKIICQEIQNKTNEINFFSRWRHMGKTVAYLETGEVLFIKD